MAQKGVELDRESFSCSICLDLLKDPVTIPCGHSYCKKCIKRHFDGEDNKKIHSCPQCRQLFTSRPVLVKSAMLAALVEQLSSDTVSAAAERTERKRQVEVRRQNIQQMIQDKEKDVKLLQQELKAIAHSADKTVKDSRKMFTEMIRLLQERSSDVEQQVRSQQETEESRVKEVQEKLEQEITELKREDAELKQLSDIEDHNQILHNYPSLSPLSQSTHSSSINICPLRNFEDVKAAVTELRAILQDILRETRTNISQTVTEVDVLLPQPGPRTRGEFLKYSWEITLDPNTAHRDLVLSEKDRKVTFMFQQQSYPDHPDRFTDCLQVLSREILTERCYWEVEWRGRGVVVAVTYENISRAGDQSGFGRNDKSWTLDCSTDSSTFWYNNVQTPISAPPSSRVGVYLDHRAGILSFYNVSKTMTLLHRVQTTFTQPLYAGLRIGFLSSAVLIKMK